eukprot:6183294-Pleurochrysis_carterae.AAC.1
MSRVRPSTGCKPPTSLQTQVLINKCDSRKTGCTPARDLAKVAQNPRTTEVMVTARYIQHWANDFSNVLTKAIQARAATSCNGFGQ